MFYYPTRTTCLSYYDFKMKYLLTMLAKPTPRAYLCMVPTDKYFLSLSGWKMKRTGKVLQEICFITAVVLMKIYKKKFCITFLLFELGFI